MTTWADHTWKNDSLIEMYNDHFIRCVFTGCTFTSKIKRCYFKHCIFIKCKFEQCSEDEFTGCTIHDCTFTCDLFVSTFESCIIKSSMFDGDHIDMCKFYNCRIVDNMFASYVKFIDTTFDTCYVCDNKGLVIINIDNQTIIIGKKHSMVNDDAIYNTELHGIDASDSVKAIIKTISDNL